MTELVSGRLGCGNGHGRSAGPFFKRKYEGLFEALVRKVPKRSSKG